MFLYLLATIAILVCYLLIWKPHQYWKRMNVPYLKPLPIVGCYWPLFADKCSLAELTQKIYNSHPDHRYFGFYQFLLPTLVLKDPELIKRVAIKEFDIFPEHRNIALDEIDPLLANNLGFMKGGEKWHAIRTTLSPAFTKNKMKLLFHLMEESANNVVDYFSDRKGPVVLEMKDLFRRFANDVAGNVVFGVTCNSFKDRENEFFMMGLQAGTISQLTGLKLFLQTLNPTLSRIFRLSAMPKCVESFFQNVVRDIIAIRREKGIIRPDMLHLLMEARKGSLKHDIEPNVESGGFAATHEYSLDKMSVKASITDKEVTSQAFGFFLGGYETSSTATVFLSYELATNSHIQAKLQEEIDEVLRSNNQCVTYDILQRMKYMDQVVCETLRKWPPVAFTDRNATKAFTIEPEHSNEDLVRFDRNTIFWIPIFAIHRDPKYYPNPEIFDPERFHKDNIKNIKPYTFIPFGVGPRNCIGSRFALLQMKLILFKILSKFNIIVVNETQMPFKLSTKTIFLAPQNGLWLGLESRKQT